MKIVIVGSGIKHLEKPVLDHYISDNYITIGPSYNYVDCNPYDYYLWTGNCFKVYIGDKGLKIKAPKVKSILVSVFPSVERKIQNYHLGEYERLKCEIYRKSFWDIPCGIKASSGYRVFHYILRYFQSVEKIIFLGCSALAGDNGNRSMIGPHDFFIESESVKSFLYLRGIKSEWVHKNGVY